MFFSLVIVSTTLLCKEADATASISLVGMSMDYREYTPYGELIDSEEASLGTIVGVDMGLGYLLSTRSDSYEMLEANVILLGGDTLYTGSYLENGGAYGSVTSTTQNILVDMDVAYSYSTLLSPYLELSYGIGVGYHYWRRALSASQVETYTWYSLRPAVGAKYKMSERFSVELLAEYQYGINPKMYLNSFDLEFILSSANILEVSLPIRYQYNKLIELFCTMVFQKQSLGRSNLVYAGGVGYYEPDSKAESQYLKIGVAFKF